MNRKLISAFFTSLLTLLFFSCADLNTNVKEFFVFYTESAAIEKENTNSPYATTPGGLKCFNSEGNSSITLYLRNPQNYDLDFKYVFNSPLMNEVECDGPLYTIVQSQTDKSKVTLTFNEEFLKTVDMGKIKNDDEKIIKNISGTLKMNERRSQRSFDSYSIKYGADSVPPRFRNVMYQRNLGPNTTGSSYVVCFNIPNLTGTVHEADTHDIYIEKDHWTIKAPKISGDGDLTADSENKYTLSTTPPANLLSLDGSPATFSNPDSELYTSLYYVTDIDPESTIKAVSYNVTLKDDAGLAYSTTVKNSALQLKEPEVSVSSGANLGAEEDSECYTIEFNHSRGTWKYDELLGKVDGASVTSAPQVAYTILRNGDEIIKTGSGTVPLKVNLPAHSDKYTIKAYAFHKSYVDSDDMTPVTDVKINRSANYYVHAEIGSDEEGLGSKTSPFATIKKALEAVKENTDITATSAIKIRLMSNFELTEAISITDTTVGSTAKLITIEPYGIRTASLSIKPGSTLTRIIDSQTTLGCVVTLNDLIIQSNTSKDNPLSNSLIYNNTATMIMNNVTVQNSATTSPFGLILSNSPITMNNITIKNCYSSAMLIKAVNDFTITGSTITGNEAQVILRPQSTHTIKDTSITNNTITQKTDKREDSPDELYGAVYCSATSPKLTLAGKVIIKNNTYSDGTETVQQNLMLKYTPVTVSGSLKDSEIHFSYYGSELPTVDTSIPVTSGYNTHNPGAMPSKYFINDDGFGIILDESYEASLAVSGGTMGDVINYQSITFACAEYNSSAAPESIKFYPGFEKTIEITPTLKKFGETIASDNDLWNSVTWTTWLTCDGIELSGSRKNGTRSGITAVIPASVIYEDNYVLHVKATLNGVSYDAHWPVKGQKDIANMSAAPTVAGTYCIASGDGLEKLKEWVEDGKVAAKTFVFELGNNITASSGAGNIGTSEKPFKATFDGKGFTITVTDISPTTDCRALFANIDSATIQNLTVDGSIILNQNIKCAGIVGSATNGSSILNCVNKVNISNSSSTSSGIAGICHTSNGSIIDGCVNEGNLSNSGYLAGILANASTGTVRNCINKGSITSNKSASSAGGIEPTQQTHIYNCYNLGTITTNAGFAGGIVAKGSSSYELCNSFVYTVITTTNSSTRIGNISGDDTRNGYSKNNFFVKKDVSQANESCGHSTTPWTPELYTYKCTNNGSATTTDSDLTVGSYMGKDVVQLLNAWIDTQANPSLYKRWKYNDSGVPEYVD